MTHPYSTSGRTTRRSTLNMQNVLFFSFHLSPVNVNNSLFVPQVPTLQLGTPSLPPFPPSILRTPHTALSKADRAEREGVRVAAGQYAMTH